METLIHKWCLWWHSDSHCNQSESTWCVWAELLNSFISVLVTRTAGSSPGLLASPAARQPSLRLLTQRGGRRLLFTFQPGTVISSAEVTHFGGSFIGKFRAASVAARRTILQWVKPIWNNGYQLYLQLDAESDTFIFCTEWNASATASILNMFVCCVIGGLITASNHQALQQF